MLFFRKLSSRKLKKNDITKEPITEKWKEFFSSLDNSLNKNDLGLFVGRHQVTREQDGLYLTWVFVNSIYVSVSTEVLNKLKNTLGDELTVIYPEKNKEAFQKMETENYGLYLMSPKFRYRDVGQVIMCRLDTVLKKFGFIDLAVILDNESTYTNGLFVQK